MYTLHKFSIRLKFQVLVFDNSIIIVRFKFSWKRGNLLSICLEAWLLKFKMLRETLRDAIPSRSRRMCADIREDIQHRYRGSNSNFPSWAELINFFNFTALVRFRPLPSRRLVTVWSYHSNAWLLHLRWVSRWWIWVDLWRRAPFHWNFANNAASRGCCTQLLLLLCQFADQPFVTWSLPARLSAWWKWDDTLNSIAIVEYITVYYILCMRLWKKKEERQREIDCPSKILC